MNESGVDVEKIDNYVEEMRLKKAVEKIEVESRLVYNKQTKEFNLGNLKATDHKLNKFVCMPKPTSVNKEAMCEVRKNEMIKAFNVGVKKIESKAPDTKYKKNKDAYKNVKLNKNCNSNLSESEL